MNQKVSKENSRMNKLDKSAEKIGMGGNLIPNITEEKYKERMQKRKEVQTQRLKERKQFLTKWGNELTKMGLKL